MHSKLYKTSFFIRALHFKMSLSKAKCQHTDQTIKEKIEILGKLDCGVKAVDLCRQFNLSQSTLSTWKKQRCKLNEMVDAGKVLHTKCNCESFLPQVERLYIFGSVKWDPNHMPHQWTNCCLFRRLHCEYFLTFDTSNMRIFETIIFHT